MRNDARPAGEEMRDVAKDPQHERGIERDSRRTPNDSSAPKPFVTDHDPGDEEKPPAEKSPGGKK